MRDCSVSLRLAARCLGALAPCLPLIAAAPAAAQKAHVLTDADNGKSVTMNAGDTLTVRLPENRTTGYSWTPVAAPAMPLTPAGDSYLPDRRGPGLVGAGGTREFRYRAGKPASEFALKYRYVRPWEKDAAGADEFTAQVTVVAAQSAPPATTQPTIVSLSFRPDGVLVASASGADAVKLWDARTGRLHSTLAARQGGVVAVAFSPRGNLLATAGKDKTIRLWNASTRKRVGVLRGHKDGVRALAFSPDGRLLATGSDDYTVKLWNVASARPIATFDLDPEHHSDGKGVWGVGSALAFSPDGKTLAVGTEEIVDHRSLSMHGQLGLLNVATRRFTTSRTANPGAIASLAFSPAGATLVTGEYESNAQTGLQMQEGEPDTSRAGMVSVWPARTVGSAKILADHLPAAPSVAFSPDGRTLAVAAGDGALQLWDTRTWQRTRTLTQPEAAFKAVAFSPRGDRIATEGKNQTIRLWPVTAK